MLLLSMPDLSPGNTRYRSWFYSHWGRENCVILARSRDAAYDRYRQRLSIKMASGGRERYFVEGRSIAVDDDNYLVLNDGQCYGSLIQSERDVESFSIFFRPGLLEDVLAALTTRADRIPDRDRPGAAGSVDFPEQLCPHDGTVTPVMRFIRHHIRQGVDDEHWYEEQLQVLATRLLIQQRRVRMNELRLDCVRSSTRVELCRRLALAADFINSCYDRDIGLEQMAGVACLSIHHFMRLFRSVYGLTPMQYLYRKRIQAAQRLRNDPELSAQQIATQVGFNSRATFYRQLRRWDAARIQ